MKTIWKYEVQDGGITKMKAGAKIIHADIQHEKFCVWAEVDEDAPDVDRVLVFYNTGWAAGPGEHLATFLLHGGHYVTHLYDRGEAR